MFGLKFMFVFVWVNVIFLVLFFLNQGGTKLNNLLWKSTCRWALNHRQKKLTPAKNMSRGTLPSTKNNTELTDNFFWWPGGIERGTKHESLKVLWFLGACGFGSFLCHWGIHVSGFSNKNHAHVQPRRMQHEWRTVPHKSQQIPLHVWEERGIHRWRNSYCHLLWHHIFRKFLWSK